ncbi:hypothetical protein DFH29DRAFT_195043 [Suillus ampliporus]|nr:hypothetical protein DFH29DRAFT_195043 [Suillus ampliporus]
MSRFMFPPRLTSGFRQTCKTFCAAAQNSVHIQHKLDLYAQGFTETATLDLMDFFSKRSSFKKLVSMWQSDFHVNTIFQEAVAAAATRGTQYMKCGLLWMVTDDGNLFTRECNTNSKLSWTWPGRSLSFMPYELKSVMVDPLQDLVVVAFDHDSWVIVDNVEDHHIFQLDFFRLLSSQHQVPKCASLDCRHTFDAPGTYVVAVKKPAICGDRVVVPYHTSPEWDMLIKVIDLRKECRWATSYYLGLKGRDLRSFHLVDEWTLLVISLDGFITLYTLQEPNALPRRRITYLLPKLYRNLVVHATPSFYGLANHPDLIPGHVPSLESQILVLETISYQQSDIIMVIDMVIFSDKALHSETHVEIPWSDWGPKHTCCFPHHPSHLISVFGSKMAYALPQYCTPTPGHILEALPTDGRFYVHIWDFNQRSIARSESINSPGLLIRKPGRLAKMYYEKEIISNHPYTATVCHASFSTRDFRGLFLEGDRLTLTWNRPDTVEIQIVSPVA